VIEGKPVVWAALMARWVGVTVVVPGGKLGEAKGVVAKGIGRVEERGVALQLEWNGGRVAAAQRFV